MITGVNNVEHNHGTVDKRVLERQQLRHICKRKASEDISVKPLKLIRKELTDFDNTDLVIKDVSLVSKAVYRERRKTLPSLPKNIQETLESIKKMKLKTQTGENFTFVDEQSQVILVTCKSNLQVLFDNCEHFLSDGTFTYCPKHFYQQYTIHRHINGYYLPLATFFYLQKVKNVIFEFGHF